MLESVVPEGQRTPAELLVFIETRDGGRYLAGTGRRLDMPGPARAYVLFDRFKPFGGPDATTEPLDTTRVQAVLIGWGGHIGTEGEQIVVTIKSPQAFCFGDN
jgi:hypothetical protein